MKTLQTITRLSFIAIALFFVSCNKDDDSAVAAAVVAPNADSYITSKVDGSDFSSIVYGTSTAQCTKVGAGEDQLITILGGDLAANSITIALWDVNSTGEIAVNKDTNSFLNFTPGSGGVAYATSADCATATGTINITYIDDHKVEGVFTFTGVNTEDCAGGSKNVTEGSFRGTFQN